jgi:hypothetical protein
VSLKLSDVVRELGYEFVIDAKPWERPDVCGNPPQPEAFEALLCGGPGRRYIACVSDSWDQAYNVSHEIAEDVMGHEHTPDMFALQANFLAGWLKSMPS